jgi:hypothetical protein
VALQDPENTDQQLPVQLNTAAKTHASKPAQAMLHALTKWHDARVARYLDVETLTEIPPTLDIGIIAILGWYRD